MLWLGIDPGTITGYALWDSLQKKFIFIRSSDIFTALTEVKMLFDEDKIHKIVIEDARLNKTTFGNKIPNYWAIKNQKEYNFAISIIQKIGMVMRDCAIWENFCLKYDIDHILVKPSSKTLTKVDAQFFSKQRIWDGVTNQHSRDASLLVWGR